MIKLKPHKQEKAYSCTAACVRMVLEYYGIVVNEDILYKELKTKFYGTHPANVVECAKSHGLEAYVTSLTLHELQELIRKEIPVILNIVKFDGDDLYIHSVVIYRLNKNSVYILDPEDGNTILEIDLLEQLWRDNDYTAVVIKKVKDHGDDWTVE